MNVALRSEAVADLEDTARWYEGHLPGLGRDFLDEVIRALNLIEENPKSFPRVHGEIYRALIHRFPFGIFYLAENDGVIVLAVMHASRNPTTWKDRF